MKENAILKPQPSWTCAQNTNCNFESCITPQEIPSIENYSEVQLISLSHQRLFYGKNKLRDKRRLEIADIINTGDKEMP